MYTLAFDTTSSNCSIALLSGNKVLDKFEQEMEFGQAEVLMPQINKMLDQQKLRFADLGLLCVCIGPGSFTGVRSSIAATRAFSLASPQLSVTGVSAFEAYMQSLDDFDLSSYNAVIIETKRDDFYFQLFNGKREKISDTEALSYEQIIDTLKGKTVSLIGNGVERFLEKPSGLVLHSIHMEKNLPIISLAECGLQKYNAHKLNYPKPLYLRAPDVCVKS